MAQKYDWGDGKGAIHSIPLGRHQADQAAGAGPHKGGAIHPGPPATGAPGVTPQPTDPSLDAARLAAGRNVALGQGESAYQLGNLTFDYGYNPDGTVNTSNPYSRAALYQLAHDNSQRGNTNSFAANGQLYSGALRNAQDLNDQGLARNLATDQLSYQRAVHGVQAGQLNTYANNSIGVGDADWTALLKSTYPGG